MQSHNSPTLVCGCPYALTQSQSYNMLYAYGKKEGHVRHSCFRLRRPKKIHPPRWTEASGQNRREIRAGQAADESLSAYALTGASRTHDAICCRRAQQISRAKEFIGQNIMCIYNQTIPFLDGKYFFCSLHFALWFYSEEISLTKCMFCSYFDDISTPSASSYCTTVANFVSHS